MLHIRDYDARDAEALGQVFYDAVHEGAGAVYTVEQCQAWCQHAPSGPEWRGRLAASSVVVAEWDNAVAGFMTLVEASGLIDLAYVGPRFHRKGIASALLAVLEGRAKVAGVQTLHTEASLLAEPMFAANGWSAVKRQVVERFGVRLQNCRMEKVFG
ncbi:GNAT family N-acetyltransferase [Rhodobacteraceae bacterium]|nr:GNAT family N-acetyltransferase [Paracoccaceae bacterium]